VAHLPGDPWEKAAPTSRGRRSETSEAVTVRWRTETAARGGRAGPLLPPGAARGSGTRPARTGQPPQRDPSRPLQRTRSQAAKRRRHRRFPALDDRIFRPARRWRAWREVRAHGGRAGVDGVRREDVEPPGVAAFLQAREPARRAGSSRPPPGRRVEIPKPDGRQRPRGMPTVRERVGPQACQIVIAPIVAAHCHPTASGCRPRRRATPAVQVVNAPLVSHGSVGAVEIAGFVDTSDHELLMRFVARRLSERRVLKRRRQW
jgi:RNA-directed DNA polymerase